MEFFCLLAVMLSWLLTGAIGNYDQYRDLLAMLLVKHFTIYPSIICLHAVTTTGSVVFIQTYPAAIYVCRSGNIIFRCQYDSVKDVLVVLWCINDRITSNPGNITGHAAFPRTATYQETVVDSYINLAIGYRCTLTLTNGSQLQSNPYFPLIECEYYTAVLLYFSKFVS